MPEPMDELENAFLATLFSDSETFFLGMTDILFEGVLMWQTSNKRVTWFNFSVWQMSHGLRDSRSKNCAIMLKQNNVWKYIHCDTKLVYWIHHVLVCEKGLN